MSESILLVLADEHDAAAAAFVERYRGEGARWLGPGDLSRPGWSYRVGDAAGSVAVADGVCCPAARIRGVLTRLPGITGAQLPHVADEDRDYVAAEMNAFLLAWLTALPCPVLNRPAAPSLSGQPWRWEQWASLARRLGVPAAPARRDVQRSGSSSPDEPATAGLRFTLVRSTAIGPDQPALEGHARRLAEAAGMPLLGVSFDSDRDDACLTAVDPWPDVSDRRVAAALIDRLQ